MRARVCVCVCVLFGPVKPELEVTPSGQKQDGNKFIILI